MTKNLRWAKASETGTSHLRNGSEKQDCARCASLDTKIGKIHFSIVSDGAGSASMGRQAAALICYSITQRLREYFRIATKMPSDEELWSWIDSARDIISDCADRRKISRREFSATLVALLITDEDIITLHIGDGSIVGRKNDGQWVALSWPETGEYASTTYFLIDDPSPKFNIFRYKNEFSAFSLFSDGIESLALDFKQKSPHPPFFNNLIKSVDSVATTGYLKQLSSALGAFLSSEKINERTDDDKTLIIISSK